MKERLQLVGIILELQIILQGQMVSTAGGAVTDFTREAPLGLISLLEISGNFRRTGRKRPIISGEPVEFYWPLSFLAGMPGQLLRTSTGASATDPIRGVLLDVVKNPGAPIGGATYIDTRLYTSMDVYVQWAADAALAATNLSAVQNLDIKFVVKEWLGRGIPPPNAPHFEPFWVHKRHLTESANTKVDNDPFLSFDGLISDFGFRQHDESAAGDAERVDGLVRKLSMVQGGVPIIDNDDWQALKRKTYEQFPLGYTATPPNGLVYLEAEPELDSRKGPVAVIRDTLTAVDPDVTAITPGTSDALNTVVHGGTPNPAMARRLADDV